MSNRRKPQAVAAVEDALIRCVRSRGRVARGELAEELGLVASTIGVYVERLVREGFLVESAAADRGLGRPPVLLELNPDRGRFIGVDVDARQVMGVSTDFSQNPLQRIERPVSPDSAQDEILDAIHAVIADLVGDSSADVLGIGLGLPGEVDPERGIANRCRDFYDWSEVPVVDLVQNRWQAPASIENNLRSMALAEFWFGQGRGVPRLACLGVRTGVGVGLVFDGKLFRGATNNAGEIGNWVCPTVMVNPELGGPPDITPSPKTVGSMSSVDAILDAVNRHIRAGAASQLAASNGSLSLPDFLQAVRESDQLACDLLRKAAVQHAWIAHNLALSIDPDVILIAGPLVELPDYLTTLQQTCFEIDGDQLRRRVKASSLGAYSGAIGAAAIAVHNWTPRGQEGELAEAQTAIAT